MIRILPLLLAGLLVGAAEAAPPKKAAPKPAAEATPAPAHATASADEGKGKDINGVCAA